MTSSGKLVGCLVEFLHSTACLDKCHKLFFCHNGLPPEMVFGDYPVAIVGNVDF